MRTVAGCLLLIAAGALRAQPQPSPIPVRSISVKLVSTSSAALNAISMSAIAAALKDKGIHLAVESAFDSTAVEKAGDAIRDMYFQQGQRVRVEHTVTQAPPRSVEVVFEVVQLCACN
jgi:outer membrane protein assembly factor BamA